MCCIPLQNKRSFKIEDSPVASLFIFEQADFFYIKFWKLDPTTFGEVSNKSVFVLDTATINTIDTFETNFERLLNIYGRNMDSVSTTDSTGNGGEKNVAKQTVRKKESYL